LEGGETRIASVILEQFIVHFKCSGENRRAQFCGTAKFTQFSYLFLAGGELHSFGSLQRFS